MFHSRRDFTIHFVGIGGIGMSGIAEVLLNLGYRVSGSDLRTSDTSERLARLGATLHIGHAAAHVGDADVIVVSSAVPQDNPELIEARRRHIPIIARAEMLAELMRMKYGIAVAGSHGKTTTTSLIATVLHAAGRDPTAVIGGKVNAFGTNARLGKGELLVAEADESDGSFLHLMPTVAVVTNIDPEHLDHYGTLAELHRAFAQFVRKIPFYGLAVLCHDHPVVRDLARQLDKRHVSYGLSQDADYHARDVRFSGLESSFVAWRRGERLGEVTLAMSGAHNVANALAVLATSDYLDVPFDLYRQALADFAGVGRRFSVRGQRAGVLVIDDYGHHPAEVRATLAGARSGIAASGRPIIVVFQPHRYTRTRDLFDDFSAAFDDADRVIVCDIYPAGEPPIAGVSSARLVQAMRTGGHRDVEHVAQRGDVAARLIAGLQPGDIVITLGAGDVWRVGEELLAALAQREQAARA